MTKMGRALAFFVTAVSAVNYWTGQVFAWLALVIVLVCFTVVVQRYAFATTELWMQDLYVWLNGVMFMAMAGYALLKDSHVRVDIFYRPASVRTKAIIDLLGVFLFLLPFCYVVSVYGWNYVARSWRLYEASPNVGGLKGYFILKSFILLFVVQVSLQGLAMAARSLLILMGQDALLRSDLRYKSQELPI